MLNAHTKSFMTAISGSYVFRRKPRRDQKDFNTSIKPQLVPDFVLGKFHDEHFANSAGTKIQRSMVIARKLAKQKQTTCVKPYIDLN